MTTPITKILNQRWAREGFQKNFLQKSPIAAEDRMTERPATVPVPPKKKSMTPCHYYSDGSWHRSEHQSGYSNQNRTRIKDDAITEMKRNQHDHKTNEPDKKTIDKVGVFLKLRRDRIADLIYDAKSHQHSNVIQQTGKDIHDRLSFSLNHRQIKR